MVEVGVMVGLNKGSERLPWVDTISHPSPPTSLQSWLRWSSTSTLPKTPPLSPVFLTHSLLLLSVRRPLHAVRRTDHKPFMMRLPVAHFPSLHPAGLVCTTEGVQDLEARK